MRTVTSRKVICKLLVQVRHISLIETIGTDAARVDGPRASYHVKFSELSKDAMAIFRALSPLIYVNRLSSIYTINHACVAAR